MNRRVKLTDEFLQSGHKEMDVEVWSEVIEDCAGSYISEIATDGYTSVVVDLHTAKLHSIPSEYLEDYWT